MFEELRDLYQEIILDHGKNPQNFRHPQKINKQAKGDNPLCGDKVIVYLYVNPQEIIEDAAFLGKGCAICTASASMMTEIVKNKSMSEVKALFGYFHTLCTSQTNPDPSGVDPQISDQLQVLSGVRLYPIRVKCATLPWHALIAALEGHEKISTE